MSINYNPDSGFVSTTSSDLTSSLLSMRGSISTASIRSSLSESMESDPTLERTLAIVNCAKEFVQKGNAFYHQRNCRRITKEAEVDAPCLRRVIERNLPSAFLDLAISNKTQTFQEEERVKESLVDDFFTESDLDNFLDESCVLEVEQSLFPFVKASAKNAPHPTWEILKASLDGQDASMKETGEVIWENPNKGHSLEIVNILDKEYVCKQSPGDLVDYSDLIRISEMVEHPNILELAVVADNYLLFRRLIQDFSKTLQDPSLTEADLKMKLYQSSLGLSHMHKKGCVHLDVKPENFLIDENGKALVCDLDATQEIAKFTTKKFGSTNAYLSPELVQLYQGEIPALDKPTDLTKSDVFAFGMMLFYMLAKKGVHSPYVTKDDPSGRNGLHDLNVRKNFLQPLTKEHLEPLYDEDKIARFDATGSLRALIPICLDKNYQNRPEMTEIAGYL